MSVSINKYYEFLDYRKPVIFLFIIESDKLNSEHWMFCAVLVIRTQTLAYGQ